MIYLYLFIIGTVLGSFYTVIGLRRPLNESIIKPRSHCEICNHELKWYELIPIVSYLWQRGKCRHCQAKISLVYPVIEILTGGLFALSFYLYGFSLNTLLMLTIISLLIIIYVSDFKYYVILDGPLIIFGIMILILKYFLGGFKEVLFSLIAGGLLFLVMCLIKLIGDKLFKRESLGGGDIKLAVIIGLTLGFRLGLVALILSSFIALPYALFIIISGKNDEMPFGPFIITSLLLVLIFAEEISAFLKLFYL